MSVLTNTEIKTSGALNGVKGNKLIVPILTCLTMLRSNNTTPQSGTLEAYFLSKVNDGLTAIEDYNGVEIGSSVSTTSVSVDMSAFLAVNATDNDDYVAIKDGINYSLEQLAQSRVRDENQRPVFVPCHDNDNTFTFKGDCETNQDGEFELTLSEIVMYDGENTKTYTMA